MYVLFQCIDFKHYSLIFLSFFLVSFVGSIWCPNRQYGTVCNGTLHTIWTVFALNIIILALFLFLSLSFRIFFFIVYIHFQLLFCDLLLFMLIAVASVLFGLLPLRLGTAYSNWWRFCKLVYLLSMLLFFFDSSSFIRSFLKNFNEWELKLFTQFHQLSKSILDLKCVCFIYTYLYLKSHTLSGYIDTDTDSVGSVANRPNLSRLNYLWTIFCVILFIFFAENSSNEIENPHVWPNQWNL